VIGRNLRKVRTARLDLPDGTQGPVLGVISPGGTTVKLLLPTDLEPGPYDLVLGYGSPSSFEQVRFRLSIAGGGLLPSSVTGIAVTEELAADLADAESLAGEERPEWEDAGHYDAGSLPPERYSAADDLAAEGHIGPEGRFVPGLYSAWEDLEAEGAVVGGLLHVDRFDAWADLLAEGHRDGDGDLSTDHFDAWADLEAEGYLDGDGLLDTDRYSAWGALQSQGWVDMGGNLGSALFDAYEDLVDEGRVGPGADQVAAGDHGHDAVYVGTSGSSVTTGRYVFDLKNQSSIAHSPFWGTSSTTGTAGIRSKLTGAGVNGRAVYIAGMGGANSIGFHAVHSATSGDVCGIKAVSSALSKLATIMASGYEKGIIGETSSATGFGIHAKGPRYAIIASADNYPSPESGQSIVGVEAVLTGSLGDIAIFQVGTTNKVRIEASGKGNFEGGIQTGGADFAERVRVDREAVEIEPGTVLVIDRAARRGFAPSSTANSALVAGVVSTKPGVLGVPGAVAAAGSGPAADEVALAIVGIVPVKVSDEGGAIEAGDLLVTASAAGHAMRAPPNPKPGTVLGKALGTHRGGRGTVEVLLRLK
jgi:hypothetical protein